MSKKKLNVQYKVHLDDKEVVESDWCETSTQKLGEMIAMLEQIKMLAHFSVVRDGALVIFHPSKIKYVEIHTKE